MAAITSGVGTAMSGTPQPTHSPLASETPMRSPVYDPGPALTATASGGVPPMCVSVSSAMAPA